MAKTIRFLAWSITGAFTLLLVTQPVSVEAQLTLACTAIVAMLGIWLFGRGVLARWMFLALASLVVTRYMFWRTTNTLPPLDQPLNFSLGLVLLAAELYCMLILIISLIINADALDRKPLVHDDAAPLPTVDVFIPTYNEDDFILATTIAAAKSMNYPAEKLTVWLLDDGGTDAKTYHADPEIAATGLARRESLQALCAALGARYLTRAKNDHAKAGNMNNGLLHATGEIVVVLDADHAPFKSFLHETIGHFARDPKLFLVQTPHVFLNPDPVERNLRTFQTMPSENEMFYSVTQRGLDKWNSSFFCGSAALLRRAALDAVGGFNGVTITEDCETAFELHAKGWNSVFVDKPLIAGLQPESFESFIGQRSRWCQGMFQLLMLKNPLFKRGLKPIQKLAYLSSMTFWFFPLPRMIFTFAPLLHVFFNVKIFVSSMDEALAYTATYMVANLMLQNYLYGRVRWPFVSELYEYVQGVYLARAIVSVILKPRKPTFNVTKKGIVLDHDHLSSLSRPFFAIFAILAIGVVTAFYRYATEPGAELMLIVGLWTTFNLIISAVALGVVAERREPDRFPRLTIQRQGMLQIGDISMDVTIHSVSVGGCGLRVAGEVPSDLLRGAPAHLSIVPFEGGTLRDVMTIELAHRASSGDGTLLGFRFSDMTPATYMTLADLMYGDSDAMRRFVQRRRGQKTLAAGIRQFLRWSLVEPFRALSYIPGALRPVAATATIQAKSAVRPTSTAIHVAATVESAVGIVEPLIVDEHPYDVAAHVDFDLLALDLAATAEAETVVETAADWMHALLTLAAAEMKFVSADDETQDERSSIAA